MFVDLPRTQLHFNYNNVTINLAFDKQLCKPLRLRTTFKCIACEVYVLRGCLLQDRGPKVHTGNNSWLGRSDAGREEEVEKRNRKKGWKYRARELWPFSILISRVLCLAGRAAVRTIKVKGISLRRTVRLLRQPASLA